MIGRLLLVVVVVLVLGMVVIDDRAVDVDVVVFVPDQMEGGDGGEGTEGCTQAQKPEVSRAAAHPLSVRR